MATKINALQVKRTTFDKRGMIDLNHWTKAMAVKPEIFEAPHRKMFASKTNNVDLSKNSILESLFGLGKTKYIDNLEWDWKLQVKGSKPITILENRTPGNTPGKYRQPITVLVDVDLAAIGETWSPGSSNKSQVVRVTDKKREGERGYIYTLETYTDKRENYIRPDYLQPGTTWTRFYTMRGEAAESGSFLEGHTDIQFRNRLVKLRKQYKVTDFAAQAVLDIRYQTDDGKVHRSWMDAQEADFHMAMNKEVAINAMYSRIGDAPIYDPDSGYPIKPGAGLQQQIEFGGNIERYNNLSVELVEAFFAKMVYARISPGDLGDVVGFTGYFGMQEFGKVLREWTGRENIIKDSNMFINKDPKGFHKNSLATGYLYTTYYLPTGGSFRLIYNPLYDDKDIHRDIDRLNGFPLESQRITILDVTGGNGESINTKDNIHLVRKNKVFGTNIIEGRYGPGGVNTGDRAKHAGDYYEVHMSDSVGVQVTDPTVTGELIKVG